MIAGAAFSQWRAWRLPVSAFCGLCFFAMLLILPVATAEEQASAQIGRAHV
jgi:hypothetical protein